MTVSMDYSRKMKMAKAILMTPNDQLERQQLPVLVQHLGRRDKADYSVNSQPG